jgi:RNase P/RNase MRP subunit p30
MERITLSEKNFSRLKEDIKKNFGKEIIFSSADDELNRKVIEKLPIGILLIPLSNRKDFSKQKNSGFNEVMAKIAAKRSIKLGFNTDEIIDSHEKDKVLSRLKQNIELCKKNRVSLVFVSEKESRNPLLWESLGLVLGMPNWMVKGLSS